MITFSVIVVSPIATQEGGPMSGSCVAVRGMVLACAAACLATAAHAFDPDTDSALQAYYRFDDSSGTSAEDASGNDRAASFIGAPTWATGRFGNGLSFDGVDDYLTVDDGLGALQVTPGSYTIAAWVKPVRPNAHGETGPSYYLVARSWNCRLQFTCTWGQFTGWHILEGNTILKQVVEGGAANHPDGVWTHGTFVVDGAAKTATLYVDGGTYKVTEATWTEDLPGHEFGGPWTIGSRLGEGCLNGTLDEVRVYSRALSAAEVLELYNHVPPVQRTVAIAAAGDAAEPATDGAFTVTLTEGAGPVTVAFTVSGSATEGADYAAVGASVEIPSGQTQATVPVDVIDDAAFEGDETVTITLVGGAGYDLDPAATSASVTIGDDDLPAPGAFDLLLPADAATVDRDAEATFTWTAATDATGYTFVVATDASMIDRAVELQLGDVQSHTIAAGSLSYSTTYYWGVEATNDGPTATSSTPVQRAFDTAADATPPSVASCAPAAGASDVDLDTTIVVTFDEPMDGPNTAAAFSLRDANGTPVSGGAHLLHAEAVLIFIPDAELASEATYVVSVAASARDVAGNTMAAAYESSFTTGAPLAGLAFGGGCIPPAERSASPWSAGALLAAFAVLASVRTRRAALAATAVLVCVISSGCGGSPYRAAVSLAPPAPSADLSSGLEQDTPRWSPRGGVVVFNDTTIDVAPRVTVGAYTRFFETDTRRVEIAADLAPALDGGSETNMYLALTGDLVAFLGDGTFCLKAGAGLAVERRGDTTYALGVAEAGVGLWVPVGRENAFVAGAAWQFPLGEANPASMIALTAGYEF